MIPTKKLKSGFEISEFGLGTWQMGGREERNPDNDDNKDITAIQAAIDLGVTHIDTAEIYAEGHSEEILGQAIKKYDRNKLFLASKAARYHLNYADIKQAVKDSLKRLGTDYLDLYYLHRYPPEDNLEKCIKAMDELAEEGLIKNVGICNFNVEHTKRAQELSKHGIAVTQVHYNLIFREPETTGLLEYCQKNDLILMAWRPVDKGGLTKPGITIVDDLCKKYEKTPPQIAINWLLSQPNVVTLSKTSTIEHLKENLGATGWHMKQEDIEQLRTEFPHQEKFSNVIQLA